MCGGAVISDYIAPSWSDHGKNVRAGKSSWNRNGVVELTTIHDFEGYSDEFEPEKYQTGGFSTVKPSISSATRKPAGYEL
ncbi:unnamed protein product [Arabis nemorensis]|uniref:Uncharacterized protein n=1 Tax=Arabis nemorensis TaxID=586526 RepID=A0A565B2B4_9BRAS|nr:unnamed protein product [Arabis nemorensis]VVB02663.1 unnamed protein product [Arabis nemorensis]